ncbi:nucleotide-diphospho-sugar transferase [Dichotomocladium elegans]|nr:nucleotide-diphospho-sugar transferase [Dichotomocladium elegans]
MLDIEDNKEYTPRAAWMVVLTSTNSYVKGIAVIARAFQKVQSRYPLVVLYTPAVTRGVLDLLSTTYGCILKPVDPIRPQGRADYQYERFVETWTKLAAWDQEEYERVVLMDADMLPIKNMDELMRITLPPDHIAASHACRCNLHKIKTYPADWVPANCGFTHYNSTRSSSLATNADYFNSGLVVLQPSKSKFQQIRQRLDSIPDLRVYPFPDQDFLNEEFREQWFLLPYGYNALKTLPVAHAPIWHLEDVKNIHYILPRKPWDYRIGENPLYLHALWWKHVEEEQIDLQTIDDVISTEPI